MAFSPSYKDYLSENAVGSEGASGLLTEAEWNALPDAEKWAHMANGSQGIAVNKFDPRYKGLKDEVGGDADRSVMVMPGQFGSNMNNRGVQRFNDPSRVHQGDGYYSSSEDNTTDAAQKQGGLSDKGWAALVATLFAGGAAAGGAFGGAAPAAAAVDESAGLAMGNPFTGAAAGGGGFDFSTIAPLSTDSGVGTLGADFAANGGSGLGSLGASAAGGGGAGSGSMLSASGYGNAGMIAPGMSNAAAADSMLINAGAPSLAGGGMTGALSGDLAGSGLGMNMNTARLVGGLASLGAGASGHGSGGGGSGAPTDASSIIEQMARTNRVDQNSPLGTRRWVQGPDGRWTVTDSMDPAELANFRNVQGMNADITTGARDRLAALLAAPPRPRADRAINAHGFNIGG